MKITNPQCHIYYTRYYNMNIKNYIGVISSYKFTVIYKNKISRGVI